MKMFIRLAMVVAFLGGGMFLSYAQPGLLKMEAQLQTEKINTTQSYYKFQVNKNNPTQAALLLSKDVAVPQESAGQWLNDHLQLRPGKDALRQQPGVENYKGIELRKFQQYFKGIKVEHGIVTNAGREGKVLLMQLEFYPINDSISTMPILSEAAALKRAMKYTNATVFAWDRPLTGDRDFQTPTGELVFIEDILKEKGKICLAYKFNIYALQPFSRAYIYVNAVNGEIVFTDAIIKHAKDPGHATTGQTQNSLSNQFKQRFPAGAPVINNQVSANRVTANAVGSAATIYSGTRAITTDQVSPTIFQLRETGRGSNTSIETYNMNNNIDLSAVNDFVDDDNNWTAAEYADAVATNGAFDIH